MLSDQTSLVSKVTNPNSFFLGIAMTNELQIRLHSFLFLSRCGSLISTLKEAAMKKFLITMILLVPTSAFGDLLGHELTHVVQQSFRVEPKSATATTVTLQTKKASNTISCSKKEQTTLSLKVDGKVSSKTLKVFKSSKLKTLVLRDGKKKLVFKVVKFKKYGTKSKSGPTIEFTISGCESQK